MDSDVSDFKKESNCKTIYLVRHAESENNVSKRAFKESLGKLRPPSWTQIATMAPMVTFPMNTPLSERGIRQVTAQRELLASSDFVDTVQIAVHSPLIRAKETCLGLFADKKAIIIIEHPELYERSVKEHIRPSTIVPRIERFVKWLLDREEAIIAVVGHSSYFREMSGIEADNCSIWKLTLSDQGKWNDTELLFPCPELDS